MRGYWSGHKVIEPSELEARFCVEDGLGFLDVTGNETLSEEGAEQLQRVKKVLHLIPNREADFVHLYHFLQLKQTEIADIFRVSQPTVCYRLQRAALRIRFLLSLPELEEGELDAVLNDFLADPLDIKIMLLMAQTTCQSEVAKQLGVSQGLVRHRFIRTIGMMGWEQRDTLDDDGDVITGDDGRPVTAWFRIEHVDVPAWIEKYATMVKAVADNLNILREVQRPTWGPRITHALE